ncbi:N-alpha-acetyltransferase 35, NatC auxiliary subunit [Pseudocercospora fuligena]|uniref:N-alpha-acetyltransferase 35, NatC auxiliary subunit n=1 Tax=Pseudocercospora fuligena TaxID=685502 RepID=A0A8H6VH11_9PEZI|nr:N-alpha-acetyltransferase 35, NatC auxiliary subunit [Pseudocercospora fuligena]
MMQNGIGEDVSNATGAATRILQEANQMRQERQQHVPQKRIVDITDQFVGASKRLKPGELVKDEYFTLFEAVGALEIMDDKMDSGFVPPGDKFEADFNPSQDLSPKQVIWIMDELLRLEMLFHAGYPLSQNVFTSLHIFRLIDPENRNPYPFDFGHNVGNKQPLVHTVLHAYCIAALKCCDLALRCIQSQIYFEEEDFVTSLFGRELCIQLGPQEALTMLIDAITWLEESNLDRAAIEQISLRLSIRKEMLFCFDEPLPLAQDYWARLRAELVNLKLQPQSSEECSEAFSDKVQRQLATSTPPRPMPELALRDALEQWLQMCDDVIAAQQASCSDFVRHPISLLRSTWRFGYRLPEPVTLARAKMQESLTWEEGGDYDGGATELLLADIRKKVLPGDWIAERDSFTIEMPTDKRHKTSRIFLDFMSQGLGDYINLYRMVCQNRSRMRRMLTQATILWDELESKAKEFDEELNCLASRTFRCGHATSGPLTLWTKLQKLQICEWTIQVGFETDIFQPDELGIMYELLGWFAERRRMHLEAIQYQLHVWPGAETYQPIFRARMKASQAWKEREISLCTATQLLAEALSSLYQYLQSCELIERRDQKTYFKLEEQYEARMKPFLGMQTDVIPGADKLYASASGRSSHVSFDSTKHAITKSVAEAKRCLETLKASPDEEGKKQLKPLFVVCIAMSTTLARLDQIRASHNVNEHKSSSPASLRRYAEVIIQPPGAKRHHDWWIVPEVRAKK